MVPFLRILRLFAIVIGALDAGQPGRTSTTHHLFGSDPRLWESSVSEASPPAAGAAEPYSVSIGSARDIQPVRIAADAQGNVYVAGTFFWRNPTSPALSGSDVFVMRLDPQGNVVYPTYLGGSDGETRVDMTVDAAGKVYLAGSTGSCDFPVVNAVQSQSGGGSDAFVTELDSNGGLLYSTYFGGKRGESANGVAVDAAGSIYVTGASSSPNFQVTAAAFQSRGVQPDTFLVLNGP